MFEAFFGLRNRPFSPLPRVETYIPLAPVREPFEALVRCLTQEQGIGVLTAPSGAGKSLVCRLLQKKFSDQRRTILLTTARFPTRRALLQAILFELKHPFIGLSEQEARLRVLDLLQASPVPQNRMLLIVDEAHLLSSRGLEELRTLADYEIDGTPCVSLILSGQLELEEQLASPEMNALNQRVGCHACIEPLTFEESSQYLRERLRYAGNDGLTIFTPEAVQLICSASEGNPRRLNQLSDHSLLLAYAEESRPVDVSIVRSALLDLRELPLHWNAPLDLTWVAERNPLEAFAESHEADEADVSTDSFTTCDTDFDTDLDSEDVSSFETGDQEFDQAEVQHDLMTSESSVFEIGTPPETSSLEQLFEVTRFIVPGEPAVPHIFETAPTGLPAEITTSEDEAKDQMMFSESYPASEIETEYESTLPATPHSSVPLSSPSLPGGFEELDVDDAYASIDRQLESSSAPSPPSIPVELPKEISNTPVPVVEAGRDDTRIEAAENPLPQESTRDCERTLTTVQPMLDESQLLEFIHEISLDVRQFRQEAEDSRALPPPTDSTSSGQESPHRHQSLRQSLQWQFDVVEPEAIEPPHDQASTAAQEESLSEPQWVSSGMSESASSDASMQIAPPRAEVSETPPETRPYAQLFTRLQRLRRRVESVMSREHS